VTSTDDRTVQIYPLAAWFELVDNLHKGKRDDLLLRKFLMKTNYNGQKAKVDKYGRVQIPGFLRKKIDLEGKIAISQREDHLKLMRV
jgi:DNA-binding transcriptional regulator/RsmH inhibitor MraZ